MKKKTKMFEIKSEIRHHFHLKKKTLINTKSKSCIIPIRIGLNIK